MDNILLDFLQCAPMERLDRTVPSPAPVFVVFVRLKTVPVCVPLVTMATTVRDPAPVALNAARNACAETGAFVIVEQDNASAPLAGQAQCVSSLALQSLLSLDVLGQTAQKGKVSLRAVKHVFVVFMQYSSFGRVVLGVVGLPRLSLVRFICYS